MSYFSLVTTIFIFTIKKNIIFIRPADSHLFEPSLTFEILNESRDFFGKLEKSSVNWFPKKLIGRRIKIPTIQAKVNTLTLH